MSCAVSALEIVFLFFLKENNFVKALIPLKGGLNRVPEWGLENVT